MPIGIKQKNTNHDKPADIEATRIKDTDNPDDKVEDNPHSDKYDEEKAAKKREEKEKKEAESKKKEQKKQEKKDKKREEKERKEREYKPLVCEEDSNKECACDRQMTAIDEKCVAFFLKIRDKFDESFSKVCTNKFLRFLSIHTLRIPIWIIEYIVMGVEFIVICLLLIKKKIKHIAYAIRNAIKKPRK